jgi:hypothetical protein
MNAEAITISEKTIGIWRVELPGGNWLAHLFHNGGTRPRPSRSQAERVASALLHIELAYRFRWQKETKSERRWAIWALRPGTSEADAVETARQAHDRLMSRGLGGWELLRRDSSAVEYFAALQRMPGMGAPDGPEMIPVHETSIG